MLSRLMLFGSALLVAVSPAAAQEPIPPAVMPPPAATATPATAAATEPTPSSLSRAQLDRQRADVGTFEIALVLAIKRAGLELSQWEENLVQNVPLVMAGQPVARGVPVSDTSVTFLVEVPQVLGVPLAMASMEQQLRNRPVGTPGTQRVGAQVVPGDPTTGAVPASAPLTSKDFSEHWSNDVRTAVISTILDQSGVLNLKDDATLAVSVVQVGGEPAGPGKSVSHDLILSIKGSDLLLLRNGKISRDEAKRRMVETHF